jgi:uncharacterized membrane protein YesL
MKGGSHNALWLLLLAAGLFVCGFHVAFLATHLPIQEEPLRRTSPAGNPAA